METTQTPASPSFESVWAMMQDNAAQMKEFRESQKETDRQLKEFRENQLESQRETERILKENAMDFNRRIGALTNLFGEVTEHMLAADLCEKFKDLNLDFPRANPNVFINDKKNEIYLEIDIMLENGNKAMLVEAKTKLTTDRINKHIERLEKMREYSNLRNDRRTFLGAVAGIVVTEEVRRYALDTGFYLIEPSGDTFNITPPEGIPREW